MTHKIARFDRNEQKLINELESKMRWAQARGLPESAQTELENRWRAHYGTTIFCAAEAQRYANGRLIN